MLRRAFWALLVVCVSRSSRGRPCTGRLPGRLRRQSKTRETRRLPDTYQKVDRRESPIQRRPLDRHGNRYGDGNVFQFTSTRQDYADVDKVNEAVMNAANKAFGKEVANQMERDFQNCLVWSRSELRRRRWDLSRKSPGDSAAYANSSASLACCAPPQCTCARPHSGLRSPLEGIQGGGREGCQYSAALCLPGD